MRDELQFSGDYCACIVQSLTDDSRLDSKFKKHVISILFTLLNVEKRLLNIERRLNLYIYIQDKRKRELFVSSNVENSTLLNISNIFNFSYSRTHTYIASSRVNLLNEK